MTSPRSTERDRLQISAPFSSLRLVRERAGARGSLERKKKGLHINEPNESAGEGTNEEASGGAGDHL